MYIDGLGTALSLAPLFSMSFINVHSKNEGGVQGINFVDEYCQVTCFVLWKTVLNYMKICH